MDVAVYADLHEIAERQLSEATQALMPRGGAKVPASTPWVAPLLKIAAQIADAIERKASPPLAELEKEIMLLLAYNVDLDVRSAVERLRSR